MPVCCHSERSEESAHGSTSSVATCGFFAVFRMTACRVRNGKPALSGPSGLCRGQIAPVEDQQTSDAADQSYGDWYQGIPAGNRVFGQGLDALRIVERLNLLHPGQSIGEA